MLTLLTDPAAWAALTALIVMEIVLGIDNLVFISIVTNKLPEQQRAKAQRLGIGLALLLRLVLLSMVAWLIGLTAIVIDLGLTGPATDHGNPSFETAFSWRDLILIAGGFFLVWKATSEIHHQTTIAPVAKITPWPRASGRRSCRSSCSTRCFRSTVY